MDRAGIVGADGPTIRVYTHRLSALSSQHGFDGSQDEAELQQMVVTGVNLTDGQLPCHPRGNGYGVPLMEEAGSSAHQQGEILRHGDDVLLVGFGSMVYPAMQVAEILSEHGLNATVVNARFAKPLDTVDFASSAHWSRCHPGRRLSHGRLWSAEALLDADVVVPVNGLACRMC